MNYKKNNTNQHVIGKQNNTKSSYNVNYNRNKTKQPIGDDDGIKSKLIDYIYDTIDLAHFKYKLIEVEEHLLNIKNNFYISPNYNGTNSLLVFKNLAGKHYSFLIDRKTLNYNKNQVDINSVNITPIRVRLDKNIYNGTIMDGIVLNNQTNGKHIFVINDIYMFRGQKMLHTKMPHKEININTYLNSQLVEDTNLNNIELVVNKFYTLDKIKKVIEDEIETLKYSSDIKGIAFFPEKTGIKYIYLYNNVAYTKPAQPVQAILSEQKEELPEVENGIVGIFEIRSTEKIDVYKLYLLNKIKKNNKKIIKSKKIGIAHIPTQECSKLCQNILSGKAKALIECTYNKEKNKWMPTNASNSKRPNYISEIYK